MPYVAVPDHLAGDVFTLANWQTHIEGNLNAGVVRPLYDIILGASAASVDITSIPATFAHLLLVYEGLSTQVTTWLDFCVRFNNISTASYDSHYQDIAAAATITEAFGGSYGIGGLLLGASSASGGCSGSFLVTNYNAVDAIGNRTVHGDSAGENTNTTTNLRRRLADFCFRSTAAINRITVFPSLGNFSAGTRVTLLGVPYI